MRPESTYSREGYLHENFRYFHLRDNAGQERDYHFHEFDKMVFLLSGSVTYLVEDTACRMEPGDVVLVKHHTIHKAEIDRSIQYDRVIIYLDPGYIDRTAPSADLLRCFDAADRSRGYLLRPDEDSGEKIKKLLSELEDAVEDSQFGADMLRSSCIIRLLVQMDRIMLSGGDVVQTASAYDAKTEKIMSYINENLSSELSVDMLSDMAYMSRYHFMRLFKAQTGMTVHGYIKHKRLMRAAQLIRAGTPVTKAAAECGYNDYSAFHRAFRDTFGISPAELKR